MARLDLTSTKATLIGVAIIIGLAVLLVSLVGTSSRKNQTGTATNTFSYGIETRLIMSSGCCLVAASERDLYELSRMASANDELSIRQMMAGGRIWSESAGSRVVVMGSGAYGTGVEVKFMNGKRGWIGPKMLQTVRNSETESSLEQPKPTPASENSFPSGSKARVAMPYEAFEVPIYRNLSDIQTIVKAGGDVSRQIKAITDAKYLSVPSGTSVTVLDSDRSPDAAYIELPSKKCGWVMKSSLRPLKK